MAPLRGVTAPVTGFTFTTLLGTLSRSGTYRAPFASSSRWTG